MRTSVWVAVLSHVSGRVLIARRARHVRNGGLWNFLGGGLDDGECLRAAAARELREEGGIHCPPSALSYLGEAVTLDKRNVLLGLSLDWERAPVLNEESDDWRWVAFDDLRRHGRLHPATARLAPFAESFVLAAVCHDRPHSVRGWPAVGSPRSAVPDLISA